MNKFRKLLLPAVAFALVAANASVHAAKNSYDVDILVSDGFMATPNTDPHLVNGWGVAFNPTGFVWVADNGAGVSTLYDGHGVPSPLVPQPLVVTIPAATAGDTGTPTGIVFNSTNVGGTGDFAVTGKPSFFIFATEDGLIAAWAPGVAPTNAIRMYPAAADAPTAVYKGIALANDGTANHLYATDFLGGKIDVFDTSFAKVTLSGSFTDPKLPKGYSPFNVQNIGGNLIVTFGKRDEEEEDEEAKGKGFGVVDEFSPTGHLIRRIAQHGKLNAPWGVALAPASFGKFGGDLLIGNFGDGTINAYDAKSGKFKGQLKSAKNKVLHIDGLWGMAFGNGVNDQSPDKLYFAAGPVGESHGMYGSIAPAPRHHGHDADGDEDEDEDSED